MGATGLFNQYLAKKHEKRAAIKKALGLPAPWQTNTLWIAGLLKNLIALMSPQLLALRAAGLVGKNINVTFALRQCSGSFPPQAAC